MFTFPGDMTEDRRDVHPPRGRRHPQQPFRSDDDVRVREPPGHLQKTVLVGVITIQTRATCGCSRLDRDTNATIQRVTCLLLTFWRNCSIFSTTTLQDLRVGMATFHPDMSDKDPKQTKGPCLILI